MAEPLTITAPDGVTLEAQMARATGDTKIAMVLCHPHPQYGGTMRSLVIGALFQAMPAAGVTCLRFNFRGVEGSGGTHDHGKAELGDVSAAIAALASEVGDDVPLVLTGWSFGADMALETFDPAVDAWIAIAPPLHYTKSLERLATDERPKLLVLAEHDEVHAADEVAAVAGAWTATTVEVVPGASHFFVGCTDKLVELARRFVEQLAG